MTDWEIRGATENDRDAAIALLEAAHGKSVRTAEEWDWLFRDRLAHYVVADAGRLLAAQYALAPRRVVHQGKAINGLLSLDTATHPTFTRRGLMTELARTAYRIPGADLVFGFPNGSSAPNFFKNLGWRRLDPLPLFVRPLPMLGFPLRARAIEPFDRFGSWVDEMWDEQARRVDTAVVRDAEYLNWRYCDSPRLYERFAYLQGGGVVGYSVLRIVPWRRSRLAYIMDSGGEAGPALGAAVRFAASRRASAVLAVVTPSDRSQTAFERLGFLRAPRGLRERFVFGVRTSHELEDDKCVQRIGAWHLTAGDFDHI